MREAAQCAGVDEDTASAFETDKSLATLAESYRNLSSLDEEQRLVELEKIATHLLQDVILIGDRRTCLFILRHRTRGHSPSEVLARSVIKSLDRQ